MDSLAVGHRRRWPTIIASSWARGRSGRRDLVDQLLALLQAPRTLRSLHPQLRHGIARIGVSEVLLEAFADMVVKALDDGVVAGGIGDDAADLRLEGPIHEGVGLL